MIGKKVMNRHIGQKHTDDADKKFKCTLCGKGFYENKALQDHINTHTGAKPYMCTFCGAAFASHGTWRMHERTVHLGMDIFFIYITILTFTSVCPSSILLSFRLP